MRHWLFAVLVGLALGAGTRARAQDAVEAQLLFERGAELYRARRFGEALEAMVASNRLVPNANVVFNVAQIYELLDRPSDAFNWYQRHLGFSLADDARARAQERVEKLLPRVAVLRVQTTPTGAEVYIDRVELGAMAKTPCEIAVTPGEHVVMAALEGHREQRAPAQVAIGERIPVELSLERSMGRVHLESDPEGAQVFADGRSTALGQTPLSLDLPVGTTRLALQLPGYLEQRLELAVAAGQPLHHRVSMVRDVGDLATLVVGAAPEGARVKLDGHEVGATPLTLAGLSPGIRTLQVAAASHQPWSTDLQLVAGSRTHVQAQLVSRDAEPWPYWSMLGYACGGALFAAGATVGVVSVAKNNERASAGTVEELNITADVLMGSGIAVAAATLLWSLTADPPPRSSGKVSTRP